jgi:Ser/Thr protein kinase RdoA (MazF antagonist)
MVAMRCSEFDSAPEELLREVVERYALSYPSGARRLTGGYANDVFRLEGVDSPTVLHVKHPPADADSMDWEHRLLTQLSVHLPEALPPVPAIDGSTWFWFRGRPVWLIPWAPGGPARPEDREAVATVLARLHSSPVEVASRPRHARLLHLPLPPVRDLPTALAPWQTAIADARAELTDLVRWLERERRPVTGTTHNDIFPGNVLVHQGRVTAVLDWEEAEIDWQVWDLASSLWPFCSRGERLDDQAAGDFLAAYRAAGGPVPPDEDDLIVPLVRAKLLLEVLRAPTDRDPRWDHQLANLRAYATLSTGG